MAERQVLYSQPFMGIREKKPTIFSTMEEMKEAKMVTLEDGSLYKVRLPLNSAYDAATDTYKAIQSVANMRPRGVVYFPASTPSLVYFYGTECDYVSPLTSTTDRLEFPYDSNTSIWTAIGSANGYKYKYEFFYSAADEKYLFVAGGGDCRWIKVADYSTGAIATISGANALALKDSRLWVGAGDKIYYSAVNDGLTFTPATNFLRLFKDDTICEMKVYDNILFVFTDKGIYYVTGNDTSDFVVKLLEDTVCLPDSTFDSDSDGVYFIDKYANVRIISSNPNYSAGAKSTVVSSGVNFYQKFIQDDLKYPSAVNIARNQEKLYFSICVSGSFAIGSVNIDCTQNSSTDWDSGYWTDVGNNIVTKSNTWELIGTTYELRDYSSIILANQTNFDMVFEVDVTASTKKGGSLGLAETPALDVNTKGIVFEIDPTAPYPVNFKIDGSTTNIVPSITTGRKWVRIQVYNVSGGTADVKGWYRTSNPSGVWGTADVSASGIDVSFATWYIAVFSNANSNFLPSQTFENFYLVEEGLTTSISLDDVKNFIHDFKTKEFTEFKKIDATTSKTVKGIEYMCPSKDEVLNTAQYFGCQQVETPGDYSDGNNYIGIYNQKGTTKDDTELLIESNDFNLNSNNIKLLKEFYIKMTTPTSTVNLYLMKEEDFDDNDWGSAIELVNGWNTLPRTFRSRRFKYKITTEEETEFAIQQIGFDFIDMGIDAH